MKDEELTSRFGNIDQQLETIDRQFEAIDRRFDAVDRRFEAVDRRFDAVDGRFDAVDRRFDAVDQRFDAVDQRFEHIETFVREEGAATRRHMDVVADGLRTEIKVIADGHTALVTSLAALASRQERTERRVDRVEDGQLAHEHRLRKLEEPDRA